MKKQYIYAGVSVLFWSTLAVTAKLMLNQLTNMQLLCLSSFVATLALLLVSIFTRKIKLLKSFRLKDYLTIILIGLPGNFFYYIFYYAGAERLLASQAFIINYLWPIMSVVFACIILKEKLNVKKAVAIAMSFIGVMIVAGKDLLYFDKDMVAGVVLCVMCAVSYGFFTAISQLKNYDKCISMMIYLASAFVITGIILIIQNDIPKLSVEQVSGVLWNGICAMAIPNTLWIMAVGRGNTAKISNLAYITPFISLVWSALILKEPLTSNSIFGLSIIVAGVLVQMNSD